MPLIKRPQQRRKPKINCSPEFDDSLNTLLKIGAIETCTHSSNEFISSYFLRKKPNGKDRFILNLKKFNNKEMTMSVPRDKILKINSMIESVKNKTNIKIREFARLIGTLVSVCPAVTYGWAHIKNFEREKYRALRIRHRGNYEGIMEIPEYLKLDFSNINLIEKPYFLTIYTDASLTGWGASCKGQIASGAWSPSESHFHINYLELLAVLNGLKSFAKEPKNCNILLRVDNITAISYINRMGGIKFAELNDITRKIWEWCEERKILIFASYINTRDNDIADAASRKMHVETEYSLHKTAFNEIRKLSAHLKLICLHLTKTKNVKSLRHGILIPNAQLSMLLRFLGTTHFFYAFPPFPLLQKVINKIKTEKAKGIVVYPIWKSQPWFPILENLRSSDPIIFTPYKSLLLSPFRGPILEIFPMGKMAVLP
ncbi:hypothetical protein NQ315_006601 [Exocentrus adspersus]|uniref:RNase H type-1 domain-containing protein n=1 Tax=Exocentrus adspersus TaxID=1586481 RepID=A0AAV8VG18_9CUCU|nr:hypothetical protein NQ315_006601 [Exocentrus adspersus]